MIGAKELYLEYKESSMIEMTTYGPSPAIMLGIQAKREHQEKVAHERDLMQVSEVLKEMYNMEFSASYRVMCEMLKWHGESDYDYFHLAKDGACVYNQDWRKRNNSSLLVSTIKIENPFK